MKKLVITVIAFATVVAVTKTICINMTKEAEKGMLYQSRAIA